MDSLASWLIHSISSARCAAAAAAASSRSQAAFSSLNFASCAACRMRASFLSSSCGVLSSLTVSRGSKIWETSAQTCSNSSFDSTSTCRPAFRSPCTCTCCFICASRCTCARSCACTRNCARGGVGRTHARLHIRSWTGNGSSRGAFWPGLLAPSGVLLMRWEPRARFCSYSARCSGSPRML